MFSEPWQRPPSRGPAVAKPAKVLRFVPESDVAVIDPIWTTATVTRNHGYLLFDTLYGQTARYDFQPQMVEGHTVEADGRLWHLTLREDLRFHDGEPVLARDVVASIRRFAARDAFARALMDATDELTAASDRVVQFRLKRPFPLLPAALGKTGTSMPCIMPERLAKTDANTQVTEMVGSGPFRFKADERVPGALTVYERFDGYVPRRDGTASFTAGPKRAHFDRIEWRIVPDASTPRARCRRRGRLVAESDAGPAGAAQDQAADPKLEVLDPAGGIGCLRFNHLHPPFDNPAIRRALLGAIDQTEFMSAVAGDERALWKDHVGVFSPDAPMATRRGHRGAGGRPRLRRGEARPRGSRLPRRARSHARPHRLSRPPIRWHWSPPRRSRNAGSPSISSRWTGAPWFSAGRAASPRTRAAGTPSSPTSNGTNNFDPAGQLGIRGNGDQAWFGWPRAPRLEELRAQWFAAPDLAAQKAICAEIQRQFFVDVPYLPLGAYYEATAYRGLTGVRSGFPQFYDVRPA